MQIIEHSVVGTRSAILRLKRPDTGLQIVLYPMIHVAEPRFYQTITDRLGAADLIVTEGITGPTSPLVRALTLTYRVIPANRRNGVVRQHIDYGSLGVPVLNPDVTTGEFGAGWHQVPLRVRLVTWALVPFAVVAQFVGGRRFLLSPEIEVSDQPSPAAADAGEFAEHLNRALIEDRDARALAVLAEIVRRRGSERVDVAVVYGAAHMPAIVHGLTNGLGYRVRDAEWVTVLAA